MKKLKENVFNVIVGIISMEEFEAWLYSDSFVIKNALENELVLEILLVNLKTRDSFQELEALCFRFFSREEFLIYQTQHVAKVMEEKGHTFEVEKWISTIANYYDHKEPEELLYHFESLSCLLDYGATYYGYNRAYLNNEVRIFGRRIQKTFENLNLEEKIECFKSGELIEISYLKCARA
ncbi:MAG: hypothetical protein MK066_00165 [Crocinitomicaceae bacterium]|nr:hypothetical protein [Crocinitomicaceae bacterium]